jgi:hypothetical protein
MASTYSSLLRIELMGNGDQPNTWGTTANTQLGTVIEQAIAGRATVTVADSGDTTLTTANGTSDQARCMALNLTGALTSGRNVICPSISKLYVVQNNTTGSQEVTVKTSAGTGVAVAAGDTAIVYCDGTNVVEVSASGGGGGGGGALTDAIEALSTNGIVVRTSSTTAAARTITAGTGISVANGNGVAGNPTISNTGVVSLTAGPGVSVDASTGAVTISATGTVTSSFPAGTATAPGWPVTGDTDTGLYSPSSNTLGFSTAGTARATINSNGKLTLFTPSTATASLNLPHGTAPTSPVNGDVWTTSSGMFAHLNGTTTQLNLTAGTGTVTSVGLLLPNIFSITNSPVTTTGTLTGSFVTQTANTIFAGPASGGAATPTFRALTAADFPLGLTSPGAWVQLSVQTISGTPTTVDFTTGISSTYDEYEITLSNVVSSAGAAVYMRTSSDGGSTFDSGASAYYTNGGADDHMFLSASSGASAAPGSSGFIRFCFPSAASPCHFYGMVFSGNTGLSALYASYRDANAAVNAVRFYLASGTFTSGTIKLFGRQK